jgi:ribose-phosphate pyrophosphokinase
MTTPLPNDPIIIGNGMNPRVVGTFQYPDGMPGVKQAGLMGIHNTRHFKRLLVRVTSAAALLDAMFFVDALVERGVPAPELILPYVPGARQDRLFEEGDYLFGMKSVAKLINERKFPKVTVVDPHSDVTPALIDRCEVIHSDVAFTHFAYTRDGERVMANAVASPSYRFDPLVDPVNYTGVLAPDGGAEKRATRVAKALGLPVYRAWKKRDVRDGSITGTGNETIPDEVAAGKLLLVDDLCDGGRTFIELANHMDYVRCDLFVTHGLFSKGLKPLFDVFENVITTDSVIPTVLEADNVIRIPVAQGLFNRRETVQ